MAKPYDQIVLFGDSLLEQSVNLQNGFSFQAALISHCIRRRDVVNRGFSGYNTANALRLLPEMFLAPSPSTPKIDTLVVLLGANDAVLPMETTTQHVPMDQYKQNLTKIITHPYITAHNPKILLVTPPPVDEINITKLDLAGGHAAATRRAATSAAYSETARQVAAEVPGVVLVDLYKAIMDAAVEKTPGFDVDGPPLGTHESGQRGYLEQFLPDGLHMSGEAYQVFYKLIIPHIGTDWASQPPEDRTGYVFPYWAVAPVLN